MADQATRSNVLLLTGAPGVGKTTLAERVGRGLAPLTPFGFLTREMVTGGRRWGFRAETFDGRSVVVAHQRILSTHRVGRYGVDVRAIERLAEAELRAPAVRAGRLAVVLVDEIRPLLCHAPGFVARVQALVETGPPLVATLSHRGPAWTRALRARAGIEVWEVTPQNRDALADAVLGWVTERLARVTRGAASPSRSADL